MSDVLERVEKYLDAVDESHRSPFQKSVSYVDHDAGTFALEFFKVADLRALCAEVRALRADKARLEERCPADAVTEAMRDLLASAIGQAVVSCAHFASRNIPTEAWNVDYAGIIARALAALGLTAVACDADGLYDHESLRAALDAAREAR